MKNIINNTKGFVSEVLPGSEEADFALEVEGSINVLNGSLLINGIPTTGGGNVAPSNSLFVDAVRGTSDGQRNNAAAPFATVQQAIDAAEPGDTIFLVTNIEDHHAIIPADKPGLKIVGLGKFATEWSGDGNISDPTLISLTGVTLENFRLRGGDDGALYINADEYDVDISNIRFEDWIEIENGDRVRVLNSDVEDIGFYNCSNIVLSHPASDKSTYVYIENASMDLYSSLGNIYVDLYNNSSIYAAAGSKIGSIYCQSETVNYVGIDGCEIDNLYIFGNTSHGIDATKIRNLNIGGTSSPTDFYASSVSVLSSLSIGANVTAFLQGTNPPQGSTYISGILYALNAYNKSAPPTNNDDETKCFRQGSLWIDDTNNNIYMCINAVTNSALWVQLN